MFVLCLFSSSLNDLVRRLTDGILESYEQLLNNGQSSSLSQNRSLQLLFDLKFLMNILGHKENVEVSSCFFFVVSIIGCGRLFTRQYGAAFMLTAYVLNVQSLRLLHAEHNSKLLSNIKNPVTYRSSKLVNNTVWQ
jgi:hypothetical protein